MSFHGVHLLAPGESFRPWPKPPAPPNPPDVDRIDPATHCAGCGAVLQLGRWTCAWCTLPYPNAPRGDMAAIIEVTSLADVAPRYWTGWEPPRPIPPSETPMAVLLDRADPPDTGRVWWAIAFLLALVPSIAALVVMVAKP